MVKDDKRPGNVREVPIANATPRQQRATWRLFSGNFESVFVSNQARHP
jgi:hypothetical protein